VAHSIALLAVEVPFACYTLDISSRDLAPKPFRKYPEEQSLAVDGLTEQKVLSLSNDQC